MATKNYETMQKRGKHIDTLLHELAPWHKDTSNYPFTVGGWGVYVNGKLVSSIAYCGTLERQAVIEGCLRKPKVVEAILASGGYVTGYVVNDHIGMVNIHSGGPC